MESHLQVVMLSCPDIKITHSIIAFGISNDIDFVVVMAGMLVLLQTKRLTMEKGQGCCNVSSV
jgi:hypothetical protein